MGIYLSIKNRPKSIDYLFVDEVSVDNYANALFRLNFKYDTLKEEHINIVDVYLQNMLMMLVDILNSYDGSSVSSISYEDRIRALEDEIFSLTVNFNSETTKHGILKITPTTQDMDFEKDGTMIKFTQNNRVYTTTILKNGEEVDVVLPTGEYEVNIVNSLNNNIDSVFSRLWDTATSQDDNHTMKYTVVSGVTELNALLEYEQV